MSKYKRRNKGQVDAPTSLEDVPHPATDQDKSIKEYILKALRSGFKELKPETKETK